MIPVGGHFTPRLAGHSVAQPMHRVPQLSCLDCPL